MITAATEIGGGSAMNAIEGELAHAAHRTTYPSVTGTPAFEV